MATDKPASIQRHLVYEKLTGEQGIWIADVDGSNARLLVPGGTSSSISPDGRWVAYAPPCEGSSSDCDETYIVSTKPGAEPRPLMAQVGWPARWSPDSTRIVTTLSLDGDTVDELVTIDVASGKEVTLARGDFWGWSISPDGKRVVFARAHGEASDEGVFPAIDLYVTELDGGDDPKPVTNTGDSAYPVWGPKAIAFARLIPAKQPSPNTEFARDEIWRIEPDGTGRRTLSGPLPERFLKGYWHCIGLEPSDWSDDGSALLAAVHCEGVGQTVAVDPETGAIQSLGEGTFTVGLSRDGQFALVQWGDERVGQENERVLIYPYAGGKPTIVARGAFNPSWNR
jgi:hypothetical protein